MEQGRHCCRWKRTIAVGRKRYSGRGTKRQILSTSVGRLQHLDDYVTGPRQRFVSFDKRGLQQLARGAGVPFNLREIPQQAVEFGADHTRAS